MEQEYSLRCKDAAGNVTEIRALNVKIGTGSADKHNKDNSKCYNNKGRRQVNIHSRRKWRRVQDTHIRWLYIIEQQRYGDLFRTLIATIQ